MEIQGLLLSIVIIGTLMGTVILVNKLIPIAISPVKYPAIDGLRGYLAFFVFLHHGYIWQHYCKTGIWEAPKSLLFLHFGQTSVVIFFVITAFLFTTKILESKTEMDWGLYLKARFLRLFPMYFITILVVFVMVLVYTGFHLNTDPLTLLAAIGSWLFFTVSGPEDINGFKDTYLMNSGVTWTLPYEWMFYFLLPLLGLLFRKKIKLKIVLWFTLGFLIILYFNQASLRNFTPFYGGIITAFLLRNKRLKSVLQHPLFTIVAITLLVLSVCFFENGRKPIPVFISAFVLLIIASGNSFLGLLTSSLSRKFGQITYSLYLIHGTVLFILFYGIIGTGNIAQLSDWEYWGIIAATILPLLFISQFTFKYIELPMMNRLKHKKS